jgi:hypothetical protein
MPEPVPSPEPAPSPEPIPELGPTPTPDPAPPTAIIISIVSSFGSGAYVPNPLSASVGATLVWTNNDTTRHLIVLDDGTPVGEVGPGESTAPIVLATPTASYHCVFHPSMTGIVADPSASAPLPPDEPPPPYDPPPYDPSPYEPPGPYDGYNSSAIRKQ